jgi:hypothetical protein
MNHTQYANPWHNPNWTRSGPATFISKATPVEHAGYSIYQRGDVWDVVTDDTCIAHTVSLERAKAVADARASVPQRKWVMATPDLAHLMSVAIGAAYAWPLDGAAELKMPVRPLADGEAFDMTLTAVDEEMRPFLAKHAMWVIDEYDLLTLTRRYTNDAFKSADDIPRNYEKSGKCFRFWQLNVSQPAAPQSQPSMQM